MIEITASHRRPLLEEWESEKAVMYAFAKLLNENNFDKDEEKAKAEIDWLVSANKVEFLKAQLVKLNIFM
jgi:hypothetical protein